MAPTSTLLSQYDISLFQMSYTRSLRVTWLATELGIIDKITVNEVALTEGVQYKPEFKRMNKMSSVPTLLLVDKHSKQQSVMTESAAICTFLTDQIPSGASYKPQSDNILGMSAYYRFISFGVASMDPLLWSIRMHEELLPEDKRLPMASQMARKSFLEKVIPTLEDVLEQDGVKYLCEPHHQGFTTADIVVGYGLSWARKRYSLLEKSSILNAYVDRLVQRPQFKAALLRTQGRL